MGEKFIPLSVPNLKGKELEYVTHAIKTAWVSTGGPYVDEFEKETALYVKAGGAVSCQSGTAGLHIALLLCGITKEDEVIVPTLTFIAAVNPVKYIGADPIFMDCDDSLCMDVDKLRGFCQNECRVEDGKLINKTTNKHISALIVVHIFGNMADMEGLMTIASRYHLKVIEDATEALGTFYEKGTYVGKYAGTIGDIGVYSFNGNKIITTGGGGMIVSEDETLLKKAKHLTTQAKSDELYYIHDEIGYNYRMTNLQAALGIAQLEQIEQFITVKEKNYNLYRKMIKEIKGLKIINFRDDIRPNYWFYGVYLDATYLLDRDEMIKYLASKGIQTRPIWGLIHEQKPYLNEQNYKIEKAKRYLERIVNVPCSTNLSKEDVLYVVECLKDPHKV